MKQTGMFFGSILLTIFVVSSIVTAGKAVVVIDVGTVSENGPGYVLSATSITIQDAKYDYVLTGTTSARNVVVNTPNSEMVKITLRDVSIQSSTHAMQIANSTQVNIHLENETDASENLLESTGNGCGLNIAATASVEIIGNVTGVAGTLRAKTGASSDGAAIGSLGSAANGTILISSGIVKAEATQAAAIGGGGAASAKAGDGGKISIAGGTVHAKSVNGAAIGGGASNTGYAGSGGTVAISGGEVHATSNRGAGIGGGGTSVSVGGEGGNIQISGGAVLATANTGAAVGGGTGANTGGPGGTVHLLGGTLTARSQAGAAIGAGFGSTATGYAAHVKLDRKAKLYAYSAGQIPAIHVATINSFADAASVVQVQLASVPAGSDASTIHAKNGLEDLKYELRKDSIEYKNFGGIFLDGLVCFVNEETATKHLRTDSGLDPIYRTSNSSYDPVASDFQTGTNDLVYHFNDGSTPSVTEKFAPGMTVLFTDKSTEVTREFYTFAGWSSTSNGSKISSLVLSDQPKTVYAIWTLNRHQVNLNYGTASGIGNGLSVSNVASGIFDCMSTVTLTPLLREGFTFKQWSAVNDKTGQVIPVSGNSFSMPDSSVTVTAIYKANVTLVNGTVRQGTTIFDIGETVRLSNFAPDNKPSFTFKEWSVVNGQTGAAISVSDNQFVMPDDPVTVTALYKANVTVVYGVHKQGLTTFDVGETVPLNGFLPDEKPGFTFKEWSVVSGQGGATIAISDGAFEMPNGPVMMTAIYKANVTLVHGTHKQGVTAFDIGQSIQLKDFTPDSRAGFAFKEWSVVNRQTGVAISISNGAFEMPNAPVTLTAVYKANVTMVYGIHKQGVTAFDIGETVELKNFTSDSRLGFTFKEWSVVNGQTGAAISITGDTFAMPNAPVTITAVYKANVTTVYGVHKQGVTAFDIGESVQLKDFTETVRVGFTFKEWSVVNVQTGTTVSISGEAFVMPDSPVTVTAVYKAIMTVVNGAHKQGVAAFNIDEVVPLSNFAPDNKPGFTFKEWFVVNGQTGTSISVSGNAFVMPNAPVTMTAVYKANMTVVNGVHKQGAAAFDVGETIQLRDFIPNAKAGFTFKEWFVVNSQTGSFISVSGDTFVMPNGPVTMTAIYKANVTMVSGAHKQGLTAFDIGETIRLSDFVPDNRAGFVFREWSVVDGQTGEGISLTGGTFVMPNGPVTIAAIYKVDVKLVGGTAKQGTIFEIGDSVQLKDFTPDSRVGFTFKEWSVVNSQTGASISVLGDTFVIPNGPVTVTAIYKANATLVGGTFASGVSTFDIGSNVDFGHFIAVEKSGFTFKEWTVRNGLTGELIAKSGNGFTMPSAPVTLTAVYRANVMAVSGGTGRSAYYDIGASVRLSDFTANKVTGYSFANWQVFNAVTDKLISVSGDSFVMPNAPIRLVANYQVNSYKVQVANGTKTIQLARKYGETITLGEAEKKLGFVFTGWVVQSGNVKIVDNRFVMPASSVKIVAKYKEQTRSFYPDRDLKRGNRNKRVLNMQIVMWQLGIKIGPLDGLFREQTETGVKAFQKKMKLRQTGVFDKKTRAALNQLVVKAPKVSKKWTKNQKNVQVVQYWLVRWQGGSLKVNGKWDKSCKQALKKFQKSNGIKATGVYDTATKRLFEGKWNRKGAK